MHNQCSVVLGVTVVLCYVSQNFSLLEAKLFALSLHRPVRPSPDLRPPGPTHAHLHVQLSSITAVSHQSHLLSISVPHSHCLCSSNPSYYLTTVAAFVF